ncbi:TniQ family protein [Laribacter hongkongensis]|uniref:TniQ family protein n=1 Tax=Laribacter hongkongensis TaxID=168471 RepID=UPI001EFE1642|nr:TniQ family protein [Laribacter hongkongensis]MCG9053513.1 TniQ family protein [Laribacter hongkongensis]
MLTGKRWPAHPHPLTDELLSSWLVRIAHANGLKVQTFCHREFGQNHQVWNRDIDRLAPDWLLTRLEESIGLSLDTVRATTLLPYRGRLYHQQPSSGQLRWVLPLQIYHRTRQGFGLQYCPHCLAEDAEPYFRRAWRVAFYTFCPKHNVMLLDRCPACGSGVAFHRLELGHPQQISIDSLSVCAGCGFDLRQAATTTINIWDEHVFALWRQALRQTTGDPGIKTYIDLGHLDVLHHFCGLCVSRRLALKLHPYLCQQTGTPEVELTAGRLTFEQRPLHERHHVIGLAWWLLDLWPSRLQQAHRHRVVRYNVLMKDFDEPPEWYSQMASKLMHP